MAITEAKTVDDLAERKEVASEDHEAHTTSFTAKEVTYDRNGVGALFRAPYVFGAAFLASMGGFSFGYGKLQLLFIYWSVI